MWALYIEIDGGERMSDETKLDKLKTIISDESTNSVMWLAVDIYVDRECPCWECLIVSIRDAQKELGM